MNLNHLVAYNRKIGDNFNVKPIETTHKIIFGDSRKMTDVKDESVQLVVTSPPYWQLKDYGSEKQIGFNDSYENYINNLNLVWRESYRVLSPGCRLVINIGDQFARSVYYGRYKVIPIRTEIIKFCETIGFDYMGAIIWQKNTTMNTSGGGSVMGSFPYPRNGIVKIDYEFILILKKPGITSPTLKDAKEKSRLTNEEWNQYFSGHWNFGGVRQDEHLAMFPEELPKRIIKMFTYTGETVLDPFLGSGTTSLSAKNLMRNSVGYEINQNFKNIIHKKIGAGELVSNANFEFIEVPTNSDFNAEIKNLPYIFKDPIKFERKFDPRKMNFGSKIDSNKVAGEVFYSIAKINNPEELVLSNGTNVRLIGIKMKKEKLLEAVQYLERKLSNQKVFLKFDKLKHDQNNKLLCYLYLKNKTFINAHLIKNNLVAVDSDMDYNYKEKFLALKNEN